MKLKIGLEMNNYSGYKISQKELIMEQAVKSNLISINAQTNNDLERFFEKSDLTWKEISRRIGFSSSIISQWRNNKYPGNNNEIAKAVERFLTIENRKLNSQKKELDFVKIGNTNKVFHVLRTAHTDGILAAIIGDTGTGKTTSIKEYAKNNDVIYIESNRTFKFPVEYLRKIHQHPKINKDGRGTMNALFSDIVDTITGKNIVIVIDQADYLNLSAIDIFRTLNDASGVGVVFVGLPSFSATLRGNEAEVRQVRDRIKVKLELRPYTIDDAKLILNANWPGLNGMSEELYRCSNGSIRLLSGLVYNSRRIISSPKSEVTKLNKQVIKTAAGLLDVRVYV
ncbi:MAG: AAA family ATPase [Ignavibacteriae bacterium]|nr:hypothetical protein [Ignavibacteriota bacterium]NOG97055.1 AAA family ATPase [Ignavibacteriota bacterium]